MSAIDFMPQDYPEIYDRLYSYCAERKFAGADPFDGLNSSLLKRLPIGRSAVTRLAWLQLIKRAPVNLRGLLGVGEGINPKGIALFALAELSRFRASQSPTHRENAAALLDTLWDLRTGASAGTVEGALPPASWGYNFDWQSRAFFAPQGTPTVVPTVFAGLAFVEAYQAFGGSEYLNAADAVCRFIVQELNRPFESEDEVCFSYTPLDNHIIFNASLLAGEMLAQVGSVTGNAEYTALAEKAARFVLKRQRDNGAWGYGPRLRHKWVDNFHTAYILKSIFRITRAVPAFADEADERLRTGLGFWVENLFLSDGTPKYYDKSVYPVDIHSAASAIAALAEMKGLDPACLDLARRVAGWTVENMYDEAGCFYYRKTRFRTDRTTYMRWGNAWMAYALARLIEESV